MPHLFLDANENFDVFKETCGKNYVDQLEEDSRRSIFERNVNIIRDGNAAYDSGQTSYFLRVNCFGDLEFQEFVDISIGFGILS